MRHTRPARDLEGVNDAIRVGLRLAALLVLAGSAGCGDRGAVPDGPIPVAPQKYAEGERLFTANCSQCHGEGARGTMRGPPLVHQVYEPSHHGDEAFHLAVTRGVVPHHWRFGSMPPQPQLTRDETSTIIAYVRWLQQQAGIH